MLTQNSEVALGECSAKWIGDLALVNTRVALDNGAYEQVAVHHLLDTRGRFFVS